HVLGFPGKLVIAVRVGPDVKIAEFESDFASASLAGENVDGAVVVGGLGDGQLRIGTVGVADVPGAVVVDVRLIGVGNLPAVIIAVQHAVPVRILAGVAQTVVVPIVLLRIFDMHAIVAGVSDAVAVLVALAVIADLHAIVAGVSYAVPVFV